MESIGPSHVLPSGRTDRTDAGPGAVDVHPAGLSAPVPKTLAMVNAAGRSGRHNRREIIAFG